MRKLSKFVDIFSSAAKDYCSASVARYKRDEKPASYTLKFKSFSLFNKAVLLQRFESQIFNAGGYKWKLALYPNGDKNRNGSGHISLYLVLADDSILSTFVEVKAVFVFLLYDTYNDKYLAVEDGKIRRFSTIKTEWGIDKLIPLKKFNNPSKGFLVNDFCVFGVDICVMKCNDNAKGEVFSLIKQPKDYKYTWKVDNFSQLDKIYYDSNPFNVEGYTWKIGLYPKGNSRSEQGFLSLYLMFDSLKNLPQGSRLYVEYELAILSQLQDHKQKASCSCWFGFGGNENGGWGYPNFMSLAKLKKPSSGFILDDSIIIEVKINVISNLNKIGEMKQNSA